MSSFESFSLSGKRAVVCGSSQGIGRACALAFARHGASVALMARDEAALNRVREELDASSGQRHSIIRADFNRPPDVQAAIVAWLERNGAAQVLLNNTGGPSAGQAIDADPEEYTTAFARHVVCNQVLARALVPGMKAAGYGRIINIISTSVKQPIAGLGVSNTIRAAVANWAKTLSVELGPHGITVNNILPGYTDTARLAELIGVKARNSGRTEDQVREEMVDSIPAGRLGLPEEMGLAATFLASPAAAYVNGINLPVDGGRTGSL